MKKFILSSLVLFAILTTDVMADKPEGCKNSKKNCAAMDAAEDLPACIKVCQSSSVSAPKKCMAWCQKNKK